jgi:hypothetical protein
MDSDAWWPDRKDLDFEQIEIEAAAVAHLVCRRNRLPLAPANILAACTENDQALPPFSLNAVFQAAHHLEAMSRRPWKKLRKHGRSG